MVSFEYLETEASPACRAGSLALPDRYSLAYFLLILLVACLAVAYPKVNYDGVFYAALTCQTADVRRMHDRGMAFQHHDPNLIDGDSAQGPEHSAYHEANQIDQAFAKDLERNPYHFAEELPYYSIKPLYVVVLTLFSFLGLGWRAGAFVSGVAYCLLGWITWKWLCAWYPSRLAAPLSLLILFNPAVVRVVRWTGPDVLATAVVIAGCYLIFQTERTLAGAALLIVGIWVRPEVVIFAGLILCVLWIKRRLSFFEAATLATLALASYAVIGHFGPSYAAVFHRGLLGHVPGSWATNFVLKKSDYLRVLKNSVQLLIGVSPMLGFPAIVCFLGFMVFRKPDALSWLMLVGLLSVVILYLPFPELEARLFFSQLSFIPPIVLFVQLRCAMDKQRHPAPDLAGSVATIE